MFTARLSEAVRGEEMRELIRAHRPGTRTMLGSIAGRCIQVRVQGVRAGQVASVEVLARAADLADVNDLHLVAAAQELARLGPAGAAQAGALVPCAMTCGPRWAGRRG